MSETQTQGGKSSTPPSKAAKVPTRKDESSWQSLVVAARDSSQHEKAVVLAEEAVRKYPRSDWLWRILGGELTELDRLDEAEKALNTARRLNPDAEWLWRHFATLHRKRKNLEGEIESLETLYSLGVATWYDLNQLGIAYHNYRDLAKALKYYRLSAATEPQAAPWVNLALVYRDPELSQDADAADACRRALALKPDYEQAKELLDTTKRKLVPLAIQAQTAATGLVEPDAFFDFYISPFEMLQIEDVTAAEGLDVKATQRAKKLLKHDLDLNDGKVGWLGDYSLDLSRALAVVDELDDEAKRRYHVAIFRNKPLLNFLTRGDIRHFLYSDEYFPQTTLDLLDKEPEFLTFLSKPFARQYNFILTRAIERRLLPVVEVLFDGRRWIEPKDVDTCFEGAFDRISKMVELLRTKANIGSRKVDFQKVEDFLREHSFPELFNLLPTHFASYQKDVVAKIHSLAIDCATEHGDIELSKGILSLCKRFTSRSVALTKRLEEDFKIIEKMIIEKRIIEDRQHSFAAVVHQFGWMIVPLIIGIIVIALNVTSTKTTPDAPTKAAPSHRPYTSPVSPSAPVYSPPFMPSTPSSESKSLYRIPSAMKAELDRESRAIDTARATVERMASQLKSLKQEIKLKESHLNQTNQSDVDEFNRKVDTYNGLLKRVRAQNRLVNQLIESYNEKLQNHGR